MANHSMANHPSIEVENISKKFDGLEAVKNLSLTIMPGEIFGFLGPNGSGKTTAIRMLCGLLIPTSGRGQCLGFDIIKDSLSIKERTGYMPQKFSLYEDLTVQENLEFMGRLYQIDNLKQAVQETLKNNGLFDRKHSLVGTLSGGYKQRLALSACMMHEPELLLLDEPTAGVDPLARREFWDRITSFSDRGITALVSTHYMDEAIRCHRLAYIAWGNLVTVGSPQELLEKYQKETLEEVFVHLMRHVKDPDHG